MQQVITKYTSKEPANEAPAKPDVDLKHDTATVRSESATSLESNKLSTPDTPANDPMDMEVDMNIIKAPIAGKGKSTLSDYLLSHAYYYHYHHL